MANGTSTPVLAAVPRPTDIGSEIRGAYNARENLRALLARVSAARSKVDADLVAATIRDFSGPRADGAELAVKRVDDANRERARLDAQGSALAALESLITYYLDRIRRESPGTIIAELQRRRAELERQLALEQADVDAIQAQLALIDEELKKLEPTGAGAAARARRRRAAAADASAADAKDQMPALAAAADAEASSSALAPAPSAPAERPRSRAGRRGSRNARGRRR